MSSTEAIDSPIRCCTLHLADGLPLKLELANPLLIATKHESLPVDSCFIPAWPQGHSWPRFRAPMEERMEGPRGGRVQGLPDTGEFAEDSGGDAMEPSKFQSQPNVWQ